MHFLYQNSLGQPGGGGHMIYIDVCIIVNDNIIGKGDSLYGKHTKTYLEEIPLAEHIKDT